MQRWFVIWFFLCGYPLDAVAQNIGHSYTDEIVYDTAGHDVGPTSTGIDIDSNGNIGICFADATDQVLGFAFYDGDSWSTEVVDNDSGSGDSIGEHCAFAFDISDNLHIVYYNDTDNVLLHAFNAGSGWTVKTIDDTTASVNTSTIYRLSLAVDSAGGISVAYYDGANANLRYGEFDGSNWTTEVVVSDGDVGRFASLDFDSDDNPAITYMDYTDGSNAQLMYVSSISGVWQAPETVDENNYAGAYNSFRFDSNNVPHVVYQRINGSNIQSLKYVDRSSGAWGNPETIKSGANSAENIGTYAQMILNEQGYTFASYRDYTRSALFGNSNAIYLSGHYFYEAPGSGSHVFQTDTIETTSGTGDDYSGMSIALRDDFLVTAWVSEVCNNAASCLKVSALDGWVAQITLLAPNDSSYQATTNFEFSWIDFDPDSNALVRLFYYDEDYLQIGSDLNENDTNIYQWDTSSISRGDYFVIARISDDDFGTYKSDNIAPHQYLTVVNRTPSAPSNFMEFSGDVQTVRPTLIWDVSTDTDGDDLTYTVELCGDQSCDSVILSEEDIEAQDNGTVNWTVPQDLEAGATYYARMKAVDSQSGESDWSSIISFSIAASVETGSEEGDDDGDTEDDGGNATSASGSASSSGCQLLQGKDNAENSLMGHFTLLNLFVLALYVLKKQSIIENSNS